MHSMRSFCVTFEILLSKCCHEVFAHGKNLGNLFYLSRNTHLQTTYVNTRTKTKPHCSSQNIGYIKNTDIKTPWYRGWRKAKSFFKLPFSWQYLEKVCIKKKNGSSILVLSSKKRIEDLIMLKLWIHISSKTTRRSNIFVESLC